MKKSVKTTNKQSKLLTHKPRPEIRDDLDSRERKENTRNRKKNENPFVQE